MLRSIGKQSGESVESVLKKKTKEGFAEKNLTYFTGVQNVLGVKSRESLESCLGDGRVL